MPVLAVSSCVVELSKLYVPANSRWSFHILLAPARVLAEQARQEILETAYNLLRDKGFNAVGSHEIAQAAGVSSATLYRWWKSKEEILFDACFEHMRPILAIPASGSGLTRLRRHVLRASEFLASEEGTVMARVLTGSKSANEPRKSTSCTEERTVTISMTGLEQNRR